MDPAELAIDIPDNLTPAPDCCIYRIPRVLRKLKDEAYSPKLISIGPFHHGEAELADMEKQKLRYFKEFRDERSSTDVLEQLLNYIKEKETRIRNSYVDSTSVEEIEPAKFQKMILYDSLFIMELMMKKSKDEDDFLLDRPSVCDAIWADLMLLENQLPLFVLKKLYKLAFPSADAKKSFLELICCYCNVEWFDAITGLEIKHFTDLQRWEYVRAHPSYEGETIENLYSASTLHESGLKFELHKDSACLLDVKFDKGTLKIPEIVIGYSTELLIRNIMALEQCHYPDDTYVCAYIELLDYLINSEKDVEVLVQKKIIVNWMGSDAALAGIINKLCWEIGSVDTCYNGIYKNLNEHRENFLNRTMATLYRVYFSNLWRGTATVAAFLVVAFTFIQTVYAILGK